MEWEGLQSKNEKGCDFIFILKLKENDLDFNLKDRNSIINIKYIRLKNTISFNLYFS